MRHPRTFTFHIFSAKRVSFAVAANQAADYYVNLPQLDALVNFGDRPDFYELTLNRMVGTMSGTNSTPANAGGGNGFFQLSLDLPAPYVITNGGPSVLFIVPVTGQGLTNTVDGSYFETEPVIVAASGISSMLHVRVLDQAGALLDCANHEHVITLTMREVFVGV